MKVRCPECGSEVELRAGGTKAQAALLYGWSYSGAVYFYPVHRHPGLRRKSGKVRRGTDRICGKSKQVVPYPPRDS
jgi:hypothetical protein